jgi:hypothetical protein
MKILDSSGCYYSDWYGVEEAISIYAPDMQELFNSLTEEQKEDESLLRQYINELNTKGALVGYKDERQDVQVFSASQTETYFYSPTQYHLDKEANQFVKDNKIELKTETVTQRGTDIHGSLEKSSYLKGIKPDTIELESSFDAYVARKLASKRDEIVDYYCGKYEWTPVQENLDNIRLIGKDELEGISGKADFMLICEDENKDKHLIIIDYKSGDKSYNARTNKQLLTLTALAYQAFNIKSVSGAILSQGQMNEPAKPVTFSEEDCKNAVKTIATVKRNILAMDKWVSDVKEAHKNSGTQFKNFWESSFSNQIDKQLEKELTNMVNAMGKDDAYYQMHWSDGLILNQGVKKICQKNIAEWKEANQENLENQVQGIIAHQKESGEMNFDELRNIQKNIAEVSPDIDLINRVSDQASKLVSGYVKTQDKNEWNDLGYNARANVNFKNADEFTKKVTEKMNPEEMGKALIESGLINPTLGIKLLLKGEKCRNKEDEIKKFSEMYPDLAKDIELEFSPNKAKNYDKKLLEGKFK